MIRGLVVIGALLFLSGCASTPEMKMTPAASDNVGVRFSRGEAFMLGAGERGAIMIVPTHYDAQSGKVLLGVAGYNRSGTPINFGTENISLTLDDGTALPLHDFDTLRHNLKRDAQQAKLAAWVEALAVGYVEYQDREGDPKRDRRAEDAAADYYDYRQHAIAENLTHKVRQAKGAVLQTTTIDPGAYWGGAIVADRPALALGEVRRMTARVEFAGEVHRFNLFLSPEGTPAPPQVSLPAVTLADGVQAAYKTPPTWLWEMGPPRELAAQETYVCLNLRHAKVCGDPNSPYR